MRKAKVSCSFGKNYAKKQELLLGVVVVKRVKGGKIALRC